MGGKSSKNARVAQSTALPPIRLLDFSKFSKLGRLPRYPDNADICLSVSEVDRNKSLIVFISHNWLRADATAAGWSGSPHPDNAEGDKYKLCVKGIKKLMSTLAPGVEKCYVWLDFGCQDQNGNSIDELSQLDEIMRLADCIFTPVIGTAVVPNVVTNWYKDYKADSWNGGKEIATKSSYVGRSWTRLEMFYAVNIPLKMDIEKSLLFQGGLRHYASNSIRPHILYGTSELSRNVAPLILAPLQNLSYVSLHPNRGAVTVESDRVKISELTDKLTPYIASVKIGYDGERKAGKKHGFGINRGDDGETYKGEWAHDKRHGRGVCTYSSGDIYDGDFQQDKKHGKGLYKLADGRYLERTSIIFLLVFALHQCTY